MIRATPSVRPILDWQHLPVELREQTAKQLSAQDLCTLSSTTKTNFAIARSPHVIVGQLPTEAARTVRHLARNGDADTIEQTVALRHAARIDWRFRDKQRVGLMEHALKYASPEVVKALSGAPAALFDGTDRHGDNVLHHTVRRGDADLLDHMLRIQPELAAYIDMKACIKPTARFTYPYLSRIDHPTPLEIAYDKRADKLIDVMTRRALDQIDQEIDCAGMRARSERQLRHHEKTARVFPFDRNGLPDHDRSTAVHPAREKAPRRAEDSRLRLARRAIAEREPGILEKILHSLSSEQLRTHREVLIESALSLSEFSLVRVVADRYPHTLFTPFDNLTTALHVAARSCPEHIIHWLLGQPGHEAALSARDASGRTPLLKAALHGNKSALSLLIGKTHSTRLTDTDSAGCGMLNLLFRADPEYAVTIGFVFEHHRLMERITTRDKTATLAEAISNVLNDHYFRQSSIEAQRALQTHLCMVELLLSQPAGEIDVTAPISPGGSSIIDILKSGFLRHIVDTANTHLGRRHERASREAIRFSNEEALSAARTHSTTEDAVW